MPVSSAKHGDACSAAMHRTTAPTLTANGVQTGRFHVFFALPGIVFGAALQRLCRRGRAKKHPLFPNTM